MKGNIANGHALVVDNVSDLRVKLKEENLLRVNVLWKGPLGFGRQLVFVGRNDRRRNLRGNG